jgi:hypothetical protein
VTENTHRFHIELPIRLWERFKERAIREHGSPRQAALHLFRQYVDSPASAGQETPRHDDDQR